MAREIGFAPRIAEKIEEIFEVYFSGYQLLGSTAGDGDYILNLRQLASADICSGCGVLELGPHYDFLATDVGKFSSLKALNLAAMSCAIKSRKRCALIMTARNEGPFLVEWIAYHRAIGFDAIWIYTNDNEDGSTELLEVLAKHRKINVVKSTIGERVSAQFKAYEHALLLNRSLRQFEWHMFLDADEFLVMDSRYGYSLPRFLDSVARLGDPNIACVCFNWFWMGSHGAVSRQTQPLLERFVHGAPATFVRSVFKPADAISISRIHKPDLRTGAIAINSGMKPVSLESHDIGTEYAGGRINHYWNKSFQEFLVKRARGDAGTTYRDVELFFDWDVPRKKENLNPLPKELLSIFASERDSLISIDEIRCAAERVDAAYNELCTKLCPEGRLEEAYRRIQARSRVLRLLKSGPAGRLPQSTPQQIKDYVRTRAGSSALARH